MPVHQVTFNVPERPVGKSDIVFTVYENGEKHGELRISKGALDWIPGGTWSSKPFRLTWRRLDALAREHARRMR
jgi:hypothetical protein